MRKLAMGDEEMGIVARMLRGVAFFSPLTIGQLEQVLPHIVLYELDPGESVVRQGETGDAFYIVYKGTATIRKKKGFFSFSKTVATIGPGAFFGEISLLSAVPRTATVVCEEKSQLFVLVAGDFQYVMNQNPAALAQIKNVAARRQFEAAHS